MTRFKQEAFETIVAQLEGTSLGAIRARAIVVPCSTDLYFPPEDNALEVARMANAELRVFDSPFGHCVASPGVHPAFTEFLDAAIEELLGGG